MIITPGGQALARAGLKLYESTRGADACIPDPEKVKALRHPSRVELKLPRDYKDPRGGDFWGGGNSLVLMNKELLIRGVPARLIEKIKSRLALAGQKDVFKIV